MTVLSYERCCAEIIAQTDLLRSGRRSRSPSTSGTCRRTPLTDLLLVIYKRRPPRGGGLEVFGDAARLDFWLERVKIGRAHV